MEILLSGIGYITMTFSDDSVKVIKSTLNRQILREYGVTARRHYIFCIDTGDFIPIREDAIDISVNSDYPVFKNEVNNFANRFI